MARALTVIAGLVALLSASAASAQGVGFVAGGTIDPEQFYVGTFFETPPIGGSLHIRPGIDGSWGQGVRIAAINLDLITRAQIGSGWQLYTGGGPTVSIVHVNDLPDNVSNNEVTGGFSAVFGFIHPKGVLFEVRYGSAAGGPSLKFGVGFQYGKRQ